MKPVLLLVLLTSLAGQVTCKKVTQVTDLTAGTSTIVTGTQDDDDGTTEGKTSLKVSEGQNFIVLLRQLELEDKKHD